MNKKIIRFSILFFVIVIGILCLDVCGLIGTSHEVQIVINENDNLTIIAKQLQKEHVILNQHLYKLFYRFSTQSDTVHPGTVKVTGNSSYRAITRSLTMPMTDTIFVTIPEGFEVHEIAERLLNNELIASEQEFYDALNKFSFQTKQGDIILGSEASLSGFLFPDTYEISNKATSNEIIRLMTDNFASKWTDEYQAAANKRDMNISEVITLASIVEREAKKPEDFPIVASVFHNRLKAGKRLESCATIQYILKERKPVLSVADTKIKSPYNTYLNAGLPPAPIASPGIRAIDAALHPADTDYLYFFTDKNGNNHYAKTYEEHQKLIEEFQIS